MTAPMQAVQRRTIPFDYAFRFELLGQPERVTRSVVRVSIEAGFVAHAIGYGVLSRQAPRRFGPAPADLDPPGAVGRAQPGTVRLGALKLGELSRALERQLATETGIAAEPGRAPQRPTDLIGLLTTGGIRLSPVAAATVAARGLEASIAPDQAQELFEEVPPDPAGWPFYYQLFDDATGQAFQSGPILSTAGLGIADGDRPFRQFAVPIYFAPLTTIRLEITEASRVPGVLHVCLQGYRVLGGAGTPTGGRR